jgi:hypothetical protein
VSWFALAAAAGSFASTNKQGERARTGGIIRVKSPNDVLYISPPTPFIQQAPTKCPGCGSHSFIRRGQHHVCTYCRGEQ